MLSAHCEEISKMPAISTILIIGERGVNFEMPPVIRMGGGGRGGIFW